MDWTWIHTVAIVGLNNLVLWIWKPWANAYAGEKGKNLARKEDLNEIVAEVRAVAIAQKEIEAKISGELWNNQMIWHQKRDFYIELLQRVDGFRSDCIWAEMQIANNQQTGTEWTRIAKGLSELARMWTLAQVFANDACKDAMREFLIPLTPAPPPPDPVPPEWFATKHQQVAKMTAKLVEAAKADLGVSASAPANDLVGATTRG